MTFDRREGTFRVVLLDIEGTTTPLSFVHDVLFPFARAHLAAWVRTNSGSAIYLDVQNRLADEHAADRRTSHNVPSWETGSALEGARSVEAYALWLMERDRKSMGLKLLQGLVWEDGYRSGVLRGQVFADVPTAIRRWREAGIATAIYSSGSEHAQRRLFESTMYGDLTPLIVGFFDTTVGPKFSTSSYVAIASKLGMPPNEMLFVSDVTRELAAASAAGCRTRLSVRPGNEAQPDASAYRSIRTFDEVLP